MGFLIIILVYLQNIYKLNKLFTFMLDNFFKYVPKHYILIYNWLRKIFEKNHHRHLIELAITKSIKL